MARLPLPREYILAAMQYVENRLDELPDYKLGSRAGQLKIVMNNPRHEYSIDSKAGRRLMPILTERSRLLEIRDGLREYWRINYKGSIEYQSVEINNHDNVLNDDFWFSLKADSNNIQKSDDLFHNGVQLRSRGEMIVNEVLDHLGLEYVYEPFVTINGEHFSPDFVVRIPAFGCCFMIEYLGRLDEYGYLEKNKYKIGSYFRSNLFLGTNLIVFCANKRSAPSFDEIHNSIVSLIANLCAKYVKNNSTDRNNSRS